MAPPLSGARWRRQVRKDWTDAATDWEQWESQRMYALSAADPVLIRALELKPGQRVLDFGCGSGEPTLTIAQFVAPRGTVLGLDVSAPMIEIARRRAKLRGIANARFRRGDIATLKWRGTRFDAVVSRLGLMFVGDVPGTLARLRTTLKPGGRIALAVWGPAERNPYFAARLKAALPFMKTPPPDPETVPHPQRLARPGLLPWLLREAGFRRVTTRGVSITFVYRDEAEHLAMAIGGSGPWHDLHRDLPRAKQRAFCLALARAVRPYRSGTVLRCPSFTWVVSGRR